MKKLLSLTILASVLGATALQAQTDIYIDGSTAFRKNVYNSVKALYSTLTSENAVTNDVNGIPVYASANSGNSTWTMSGQMSSLFGSRTIIVHAAFTGSVQGIHSLYLNTDTQTYLSSATATVTNRVSHTATCALSDVDSSSTPYLLDGTAFNELHVAVQPFVWVRSASCPNTFTNIDNQQIQALAPNGQVAMQIMSGRVGDQFNITLVNRSLDSGTRVAAYADAFYNGSVQNYYFDGVTNNHFYASNVPLGPSLYQAGYVGGADVATALSFASTNDIAVGYVGLSDAKSVNGGLNVLSYNGAYPSSDIKFGTAIPTAPVFDNVRNGTYSYWAYECLDFPNTVSAGGQNISGGDLRTFCAALGGYDSATLSVFTPNQAGSIDADILAQGTKVAVRIGDMNCSRQSVGSVITPN